VTRALSKELVMGKAVIDSGMQKMESNLVEARDSDYVITVEKMPKMIKAVPPEYPPFAFKLKRNGEVWIKAHIDANGEVQKALIHKDSGSNYGFEEAALIAAYKNKFEPFEVNGRKMPVWVIYKVKFVVKD
jgi:protein TonB